MSLPSKNKPTNKQKTEGWRDRLVEQQVPMGRRVKSVAKWRLNEKNVKWKLPSTRVVGVWGKWQMKLEKWNFIYT